MQSGMQIVFERDYSMYTAYTGQDQYCNEKHYNFFGETNEHLECEKSKNYSYNYSSSRWTQHNDKKADIVALWISGLQTGHISISDTCVHISVP